MISVLITAYKEEKSIAKCIECIANPAYSGIPNDFEILLACPDDETYNAAMGQIAVLDLEAKFNFIRDPGKGKPVALNLLMDKAKGDILILTDGDVYFGEKAVEELLKSFEDPTTMLVTGRPKSADSRNSMMGYFGHLLSDAAHHKRTVDLTSEPAGMGLKFVKKREFFPVSGYIYAVRKTDIRFPEDCLVDDAYISYVVFNNGGKISYAPKALAYVKYPTNLSDYFKQKARSTGGYIQLWQYNVVKPSTKTRSFFRELEYFWFPIKYAKNLKEIFWSFLLYPIRLWLWLKIYWDRKVVKKDFVKTWVRIESTK
jgi:cellulose synthase/poly-beta-1,6-N-acetylglucosamine synthase-like glycosyltransferase